MENDEDDILKIYTVQDLKNSMHRLAMQAVHTDVRLVCSDGVLNVHKPQLILYLPELAHWIPEGSFSFDIVIHIPGVERASLNQAIQQLYTADNPSSLRHLLGVDLDQRYENDHDQGEDDNKTEYNQNSTEYLVYNEVVETIEQVEEFPADSFEPVDVDENYSNPNENLTDRIKHQKLFPCPSCLKEFTTPHYLKTHEIRAHDNSVLISTHRCLSHPSLSFENISRLTNHFNSEHSPRLIRDLVVKGKTESKQPKRQKRVVSLEDEDSMLLVEGKKTKSLVCPHCPSYSTNNQKVMSKHTEFCHVPITCPLCSKPLTSRRNLRSHMAYVHKTEGSHVCQECGKSFPTLQSLNKHHSSKHLNEKNFKCDQCPKEYGTKQMLKDHMDSKHLNGQYPCATCGKSFGSKSLLRGHETTHSDYRKFGCDECDKRFRTKEKLRNHQSVHSNIKYPCTVCGSQFSRTETLKVHMKIHDESKALKCVECGKLFDTAQKHKEHMNAHTGAKPFSCPACSAAFSSSSSLCHHRKNCSYMQKTGLNEPVVQQPALPQPLQNQHLKTEYICTYNLSA